LKNKHLPSYNRCLFIEKFKFDFDSTSYMYITTSPKMTAYKDIKEHPQIQRRPILQHPPPHTATAGSSTVAASSDSMAAFFCGSILIYTGRVLGSAGKFSDRAAASSGTAAASSDTAGSFL
jgi:hypothetical protein